MTTQFNSEEPIKLRGHHIAELFSGKATGTSVSLGKVFENSNPKDNFDEPIKGNLSKGAWDQEVIFRFKNHFKSNPNLEIEIIEGFDMICKKCPFIKSHCIFSEDEFCLKSYDLKVGKTYTVQELVARARLYSEVYKFNNPIEEIDYLNFRGAFQREKANLKTRAKKMRDYVKSSPCAS